MTKQEKRQLQLTACDVRKSILTATHSAKSGHPGGSLSAVTCSPISTSKSCGSTRQPPLGGSGPVCPVQGPRPRPPTRRWPSVASSRRGPDHPAPH